MVRAQWYRAPKRRVAARIRRIAAAGPRMDLSLGCGGQRVPGLVSRRTDAMLSSSLPAFSRILFSLFHRVARVGPSLAGPDDPDRGLPVRRLFQDLQQVPVKGAFDVNCPAVFFAAVGFHDVESFPWTTILCGVVYDYLLEW